MLGLSVGTPRAAWTFSEVGGVSLDLVGEAAAGPERERWVADGVLAYLDGGVVMGVAIVASALDPAVARGLVEAGASVAELERAIEGRAAG
jgi:hypothetical protein